MHKLSIPYGGRRFHFEFPDKWDELSFDQLQRILPRIPSLLRIYYQYQEAVGPERLALDIRLQKQRTLLLFTLLNLKWYQFRTIKALQSLYDDERAAVLQATNFILQKPYRTEPPIHRLRVRAFPALYISPGARFQNMTGAEFHFACFAHKAYRENPTDQALNELCAILYRPKSHSVEHNPNHAKFCGDERRPFNRFTIESNARIWRRVPNATKKIILWWFESMYLIIQEKNSDLFTKKRTNEASDQGWLPVFRQLSDGLKDFDDIANMRLSLILYEMREAKRESEAYQRKIARK